MASDEAGSFTKTQRRVFDVERAEDCGVKMTEREQKLFGKMYHALMEIKVRIAFIGHPQEPLMSYPPTGRREDGPLPRFTPDWRKEIMLIEEVQAIKEKNPNMCKCGHFASTHENIYGKCTSHHCGCDGFISIVEKE